MLTRRVLDGAHVPPTKVFRRLTASVNETMLKPRLAAATNTYTSDISDAKFRVAYSYSYSWYEYEYEHGLYDSGESNPVPAFGL